MTGNVQEKSFFFRIGRCDAILIWEALLQLPCINIARLLYYFAVIFQYNLKLPTVDKMKYVKNWIKQFKMFSYHSSQLRSSPYPPQTSSVLRQLPLDLLSEIFYVKVYNVTILLCEGS